MSTAPDEQAIADLLKGVTSVAVVGVSTNPGFSSHRVTRYLVEEAGYTVHPVGGSGGEVAGRQVLPTLESVPRPLDIVYGFVMPPDAPDLARQAVAAGARILWLHEGIMSPEAEEIATDAGLAFMANRSMEVEHRVGVAGERRVHFIPM
ncbi:MAG: CoA-binding protein [Actinomycetota bacterium]